jgi:hypothetical protein
MLAERGVYMSSGIEVKVGGEVGCREDCFVYGCESVVESCHGCV